MSSALAAVVVEMVELNDVAIFALIATHIESAVLVGIHDGVVDFVVFNHIAAAVCKVEAAFEGGRFPADLLPAHDAHDLAVVWIRGRKIRKILEAVAEKARPHARHHNRIVERVVNVVVADGVMPALEHKHTQRVEPELANA